MEQLEQTSVELKKEFYKYGESLGIKMDDLNMLMALSKTYFLGQFIERKIGTEKLQLCVKCHGDGNLGRYNSPALSSTVFPICDVCNGQKTLPTVSAIKESVRAEIFSKLPRKSVMWFAEQMEKKLKANDHKGGWRSCTLQYLSTRLTQERKELSSALKSKDADRIIAECSDIANFSLMIADQFGENYGK